MKKLTDRRAPLWRSMWVVLIYLVAGWMWITFSDTVVEAWFSNPASLSRAQTYKGILFVLVTAFVLFLVLYYQFRRDCEQFNLQRQQREQIRQLSQFRESVIDNASVWINVLDPEGRVVLWNKAAETISGYPRETVINGDEIWTWLYPDEHYRNQIRTKAEAILKLNQEMEGFETRIQTRDGQQRLISWNSRNCYGDGGELIGSVAIGLDITDVRNAEIALRQRERQLATLMDNLPGMAYRCLYDENWTMKFVSSGCKELTGYEADELLENPGNVYTRLIDSSDYEAVIHAVETAIANAEPFSIEYRLTRKDGQRIWVWERGRAVDNDHGLMLEGIVLDISERKALEEELSAMATHDALTGLFNRRELARLLEEEIRRADRYNRRLGVLWIDLDHFKLVNDRYGHAAGDTVLQSVSQLLADSIRSMDAIGRYGGEEFVALLPEMDLEEARGSAERLRRLVQDSPLTIAGGERVRLTISVGVAVFPVHGTSAEQLCEAADRAMYRAKEAGRNQVMLALQRQSAGESR